MQIDYFSGDALLQLNPSWYDHVEAITRKEPQLLTKTRENL